MDTSFRMCFIIHCLLLLFVLAVNCSNYDRLQNRLNILEQKQFHDSKEFREDISILKFSLSADQNVSDNNRKHEIDSSEEISVSRDHQHEQSLSVGNTVQHNVNLVKRALSEEKQHTRKLISKVETIIIDSFSEIVDMFREVKIEINKLASIQEKYGKSLDNLLDSQTGMKDDIESIHDRLQTITEDTKTVSQNLEKHVGIQRIVSNIFWHIHGDSFYFIGKEAITWSEAVDVCTALGGYLTQVNGLSESTFLINLANTELQEGSDYGAWIGGSDISKEGFWIWEHSKTAITFDNWKKGEPNGNTRENCLHLYREVNWKWNDSTCSRKMGYICERDD